MAKFTRHIRKSGSVRSSRKVGGACDIKPLFMSVIPSKRDYKELMATIKNWWRQGADHINSLKNYEMFRAFQESTVSALSDEECMKVKVLLDFIKAGKLTFMEVTGAESMDCTKLFFSKDKKLITMNTFYGEDGHGYKGGGACNIADDLLKALPKEYDYNRLVHYKSNSINSKTSYEDFIINQEAMISTLSDEECIKAKTVLDLIANKGLKLMDMEYASSVTPTNMFFDTNRRMVIVSPR